jgi:hypothetical protein
MIAHLPRYRLTVLFACATVIDEDWLSSSLYILCLIKVYADLVDYCTRDAWTMVPIHRTLMAV